MTTVIIPAVTGDDQHVTVPTNPADPVVNPVDAASSSNVTDNTYPSSGPLRSAMKIGDDYRISAISMKDFLVVARRLSLDPDWAERRVFEIGNGLVSAFAEAADGVAGPFAPKIVQAINTLASQRGLPTS
ncbi:MAG TPA: hypothetical protein VIJ18_07065 [Microbacteriaceae bacterium]